MILSVTLENWMSFFKPVTFSMIAGSERQHGERVPKLDKYKTRVLPVTAIYGGNASGKTNFFKALSFAKKFIVDGTKTDSLILIDKFQLDVKAAENPSRFCFVLLIEENIFEFSFVLTQKDVQEEKLAIIKSSSEKVLYHRKDGKPNFDKSLAKNKFFNFAFEGTRNNQLFLTSSVFQNINDFRPVYDWFKNKLKLIAPDSRFEPLGQFFDEEHAFYPVMNKMLSQLDTGITHLGREEIPLETIRIPEIVKKDIQEKVKEGRKAILSTDEPLSEKLLVKLENGKMVAKKLGTYHPKSDGTEVRFEMHQESDGSRRVIDLLPAFINLSAQDSNEVYIIDEIDRSLHTLLTRNLLESYLDICSENTRAQLLFTTHDVSLMDQKLFRRDEMWVTERDSSGNTRLFSFSDYKDVRYDKDIRKSYLQGRMGGIPRIILESTLINSINTEKNGDREDD